MLAYALQVYYAPSCYAATADMKRGTVKYVYDTRIQTSTTQLFVSGTGATAQQRSCVLPFALPPSMHMPTCVHSDKLFFLLQK
jgi:hypothetical protein